MVDMYERRCYGNFFCCDDQKRFRGDSKTHEPVDVPLKTNYLGECFAEIRSGNF